MKADTSNRVALLSFGLLFLASFQPSNTLAASPSKSSDAEKADSVASSGTGEVTSGSPRKREASASRRARAVPDKTSSPVTSSSPVPSSSPIKTSSPFFAALGDSASFATAAPVVKDSPPVKTSSPVTSSPPRVCYGSGKCERCSKDSCSSCGAKCATCKKGYVPRKVTRDRRRLSRFMLRSLQHRHLHSDSHCQRCDGNDYECVPIGK